MRAELTNLSEMTMINPKTARDAFDAGTKADDAPEIKIGIRNESEGNQGWRYGVSYFDITMGDNTFSINNYKEYDPDNKRCHFNIYESSLRDGLSKIFGENKTIVDRLYGHVLEAIRDYITNDRAYLSKRGPNAGELQITSISQEQKYRQRLQQRGGFLNEPSVDSTGGLPHHKIQ